MTGGLAEAQLEQARLQNEKLALEVARQRQPAAWHHSLSQLLPLLTALLSVAGFLWGVLLYTGEQRKLREAGEREFMKPWLESQRAVYSEALTAVAAAANNPGAKERAEAETKFWELYHGRMILVETKAVSAGMVAFGNCLDGTEKCDRNEKNARAHTLGTAMAASMAATAKMSYQELEQHQFHYSGPELK